MKCYVNIKLILSAYVSGIETPTREHMKLEKEVNVTQWANGYL